MCYQCNYEELLSGANLEATTNRLRVLEVVGNNKFPLSASDIYKILERNSAINRVTVYRILDLLMERDVVERICWLRPWERGISTNFSFRKKKMSNRTVTAILLAFIAYPAHAWEYGFSRLLSPF